MSELVDLITSDEVNGAALTGENIAEPINEEPSEPEVTPEGELEPAPCEDVDGEDGDEGEVDYGELMARDLSELKELFPELRTLDSIAEMKNAMRYAALRDLGLSAEEAYLAARGRQKMHDNRTHLSSAPKKSAHSAGGVMPRAELIRARDVFPGMSDTEIQKLWQRVTG